MVHGQVRFQRAVHAQHAEEGRVRGGKGAQAQQGQGAGRGRQFHQLPEGGAGVQAGIDEAAAAIEHGLARARDQAGGPFQVGAGGQGYAGRRRVAAACGA